VEVVTDRGTFAAGHLVIAAGPWAGSCLEVPGCALEVRKKPVYWFASHADGYRAAAGCPCFLAELPEGVFYGVPAVDRRGVKLARHTGGAIVDDPTILDRAVDEEDLALVERFRTEFLPGVRGPYTSHGACMYTMSPDEHFIVDRHPEHERVVFAAGLSGHGFKFAGVLGEALADIVTTGSTPLRIGFLSIRRPALERPPA
jgi:glycine/D-amino acid oxidase-like deaminating enzyme